VQRWTDEAVPNEAIEPAASPLSRQQTAALRDFDPAYDHRKEGLKFYPHRRWPSGNPRLSAFCRSAPAVRFIAFAIFFTGDLLRECSFNSRMSAFDQVRRLGRLPRLLAISHL
jgi:hypothetical protein